MVEIGYAIAPAFRGRGILSDALGIELVRVLQFTFAYACLSAAWSQAAHDSDAAQWGLEVATLVEPHCGAESVGHTHEDA